MSSNPLEPIAVVGIGLRFPGANGPEDFWDNLREGRVFIGPAATRADPSVVAPRIHAPVARLETVDGFDWRAFGIAPNQARHLDPQHRLLLEVTWESLEDAGIPTRSPDTTQTAVYVGIQWNDYLRLYNQQSEQTDSYALTGNLFHFAANRLSHVFGFGGPSMAVDMGCASSLAAVHAACQSLRLRECSLAIAGGVELVLSPDSTSMMERAGLLDPHNDCRTFDARAAGFARGEGACVVVLKRCEDVQLEDRVYAWILGSSVNHNAHNHWISAPSLEAQTQLLREAWTRSGVSGADLAYVELHGTASLSGDEIEAKALSAALAPLEERGRPLRVGSVKTQIGHLGAASGIAGLAKVALSLFRGEIPPSMRIASRNPAIACEQLGLEPQVSVTAWPPGTTLPIAGVTATSLSGANAHVVLRGPIRESIEQRPPAEESTSYLLPLSAHTRAALHDLCRRYCGFLNGSSAEIRDIAYSAAVRRAHFEHRFVARGGSKHEWVLALESFLADSQQSAAPSSEVDPVRDAYLRGEDIDWQGMLPARCRFVPLPTYPWQRQTFWLPGRGAATEPAGEAATSRLGGGEDVRSVVARHLAAVLGVDQGEISDSISPLALGLDSLRALRVAHALQQDLGVPVSVADMLGLTVEALVQRLRSAREAATPKADSDVWFPLSAGQQALWFLHELDPHDASRNVVLALQLSGTLDETALRIAFQRLVELHPMLRVCFDTVDGTPMQRVRDAAELSWSVVDAAEFSGDELETRMVSEGTRWFDLRRDQPLRVTLFKNARGSDSKVLLLVIHHIVIDFWSLAILLDQLEDHYSAILAGTPPRSDAPTACYREFVTEEQAESGQPKREELLAFWKRELCDLPPLTGLPTDYPRPAELPHDGASHVFSIGPELTAAIHRLARAEGATLFMTLLSAFKVLLRTFGSGSDLAVGVPTWGRKSPRYSGVVGYFINPVVIRTRMDDDAAFREILHEVSHRCVAAFAGQDLPFTAIVESLGVPRNRSHHPVFQIMFSLQESQLENRPDLSAFALCDSGASSSLGNVRMASLGLSKRAVQFDLNLMVAPRGEGLSATLEYNTSLFSPETAERLVEAYIEILERVSGDPTIRLRHIGVAKASDGRHAARAVSSDRDDQSLCELIEQRVALQGDDTALLDAGGTRVGYRELDSRANLLARRMRERGVERGDVVAVWMPLSIDLVVAALAVLKSGAAYMPLDVTHPRDRIVTILHDSKPKLVLCHDVARPDVQVDWLDPTELDGRDCTGILPHVRARDLAYVMYTSGSTGHPKGVLVPHGAVVERLLWRQREVPLTPTDRVLLLASPIFDISIWEIFGTLANGASLVIAPSDIRQDRRRLLEFMCTEEITVLQVVSSVLAQLMDEPLMAKCDSLRLIWCGGDELQANVAQRQSKVCKAELVHLYGPTEAVIDATYFRVTPETRGNTKVPIGRPIDGIHAHLLDDRLREVPEGVTAELYIGGEWLGWGYLGQPGLTAARFLPDPFRPGGRMYRTGDLARLSPAGELEFWGRRDDQVKIRGYRVEIAEIETAIACHSAVRDQAVLVRETDGHPAIVAFVAARGSDTSTADSLRAHLFSLLPEYMVPADIAIVSEIPRLPSGKVDRGKLGSLADARAQDRTLAGLRSHTEELVADVWSALLGLDDVPATKNFFELGGHSLLALQVAARLTSLAATVVPVRAVFDHPTVRELATFITQRERQQTGGGVTPQLTRRGATEGPLSGSQEGLWIINELDPGGLAYAVPQAYRLEGRLDTVALQGAVSELVRRHRSLRTTFSPHGDTGRQVVNDHRPLVLPQTDFRHLAPRQAQEELARLVTREAHREFDLVQGPLFRVALAVLGDEEYALLINTHHIVCDGWSQAILLAELSSLYRSLLDGQTEPPIEPAFQYVDFAFWEREWLCGERRSALADYWLAKLRGAHGTHLPVERPGSTPPSGRGATCYVTITAERVAQLRALCREGNATLFMGLLATLAVLLHRYSGESDVVVGTPMSIRDLPELECVVGNFVNLLPLRIAVEPSMSFQELLAGVREESLQSFAHRQFPFSWIVRELHPERKPGEIPLLGLVFQLQSQPLVKLDLPGITATPKIDEFDVAPLYLNFTMTPVADGLQARIDFATDRFERSTITGMLDFYERILRAVLSDPTARLATLLGSLERSESGSIDDGHLFSFERG